MINDQHHILHGNEQGTQLSLGGRERFFHQFALGNILNDPVHFQKFILRVNFQFAHSMHPAFHPVIFSDDLIFPVKADALACDLICKIVDHLLSVIGMDQITPAFHRANIFIIYSKQFVENDRAFPHTAGKVQFIAAHVGDNLRFPEQTLTLAQGFLCLFALRDIADHCQKLAFTADL